jgi:hypothetical protein
VNVEKKELFKGEKIRIHDKQFEIEKEIRKITGHSRYEIRISVPIEPDEQPTCMKHFKIMIYRCYRILYISIYFYFFPFLVPVLNYIFANLKYTELVVADSTWGTGS